MAETEQKQTNPLAPANRHAPSVDSVESVASALAKELRCKKRMKFFKYVAAFAVFEIVVILIFILAVMKINTPKFRVQSATFEDFDVTESSFELKMNAQLGVKNPNFGHYKFDNSNITFFYKGAQVGNAFVPKARAKSRSTKQFNVTIDLSSANLQSNSQLESDFSSDILPLTSTSRLTGKVELMKVMKKKKSANMNCTMEVDISTQELRNVKCK